MACQIRNIRTFKTCCLQLSPFSLGDRDHMLWFVSSSVQYCPCKSKNLSSIIATLESTAGHKNTDTVLFENSSLTIQLSFK